MARARKEGGDESVARHRTAPSAPLPRPRRPQVVLGVGARAAGQRRGGGRLSATAARRSACCCWSLAVAAAGSRCAPRARGLRSSEETLAACAAGLALSGTACGGPARRRPVGDRPRRGFLALHRAGAGTVPPGRWRPGGAAQLAALRALDAVPPACAPRAVPGRGARRAWASRCSAGRLVARVALVTTAPWWVAGVVAGRRAPGRRRRARGGSPPLSWSSPPAACSLARLRGELDPLTGPPRACRSWRAWSPGAALTGACSSLGTRR